jgi:hypothetical protein
VNWIVALIGGLGIGSLITSVVSHLMTRRAAISDRWYQEKRQAYLGLLNALHDAAVEPSDQHSKAYALWQTQCSLFGSPSVMQYAQMIVDTNDAPYEERNKAFKGLLEAMRLDLRNSNRDTT